MFLRRQLNSALTHCVLGKAIGRAGRVIKVKLLPLWLFLSLWRGTIGGEVLLLSCFTPTLLPSLPFFL